jgi:hypothetical protein
MTLCVVRACTWYFVDILEYLKSFDKIVDLIFRMLYVLWLNAGDGLVFGSCGEAKYSANPNQAGRCVIGSSDCGAYQVYQINLDNR